MSFDTSGIEAMKMKLQMIAQTTNVAEEELSRIAYELRDTTRNMAPIDFGDLHRAIQTARRGSASGQRNAKGHFIAGFSTWEIFINDRTSTADPDKIKKGIMKVIDYAWGVDAHMGWAGNPQELMPSDDSVANGNAHNVIAGGRFMERAVEAWREKTHIRLTTAVHNYTNSLDK